jgi:hypothetical protein
VSEASGYSFPHSNESGRGMTVAFRVDVSTMKRR